MRQFMPTFKRASTLLVTLALAVGLVGPSARAQEPASDTVNAATTQAADVTLSTAIPYQGQLNTSGAPANGAHDFQFKLFDAASAGAQVGSTLVKEDVSVANGLFATELDFGATPFAGQARWLGIAVRPGASTNEADYVPLTPRRPLLAVPYALYSLASGGNPAYGAAAGAPVNSVYVTTAGNVGIGTAEPGFPLVVNGRIVSRSALSVFNPNPTNSDAAAALEWINDVATMRIGGGLPGALNGFEFIGGSSRTSLLRINGFGNVGIGTTAPAPGAKLDVAGTTRTDVLVIDAGSDLAEPFDINGADTIEPGMVVAIDADNPGQLRLATAAYDRTVAGVVSGAGGINPGLILQQEGTVAAGEHPVALSGRVYVYADATNGAIEPGDLLTTSDTPGHAMKVTDHALAQGAILGKAMSRLADGTGLVLILVTLQ